MRILLIAAASFALGAVPAVAQKKEPTPKEIMDKRKAEELDKGYSDAMKRTTGTAPAAGASDPWANVRSATPETKPVEGKPRR